MDFIEASIFILFLAVLSVPVAVRFRIPLEIFLFMGSCIVAYFAGITAFQLSPNVIFEVFLPPILFSAAYFTSWRDFKFNLRPILQLAFGLVIFTTVLVAVVVKWLIPGFSWPEAFLLGAIISPTDASAATSIIRKFNVPKRFLTIIEGESLVNDATALILYRFSLAAILYGSFSLPKAIGQFAVMSIGAIVVGFALASAAIYFMKKINHNQAETVLTFITAYTAYFVAEHLGCSGVISTVVAGIYFGIHFPEIADSKTRINAKASWDTCMFIIMGFVYTSIGLELPKVLSNLQSYSATQLILYGAILSATVMIVRIIWIYPSAYLPRKLIPSIGAKDPMPPVSFLFALSWVGMRGVVSLAAALAIPRSLIPTEFATHIDLIIFLIYFMVVTTLLIPSLTLPFLIKLLGISSEKEQHEKTQQEAQTRIHTLKMIREEIKTQTQNESIPANVYQEFMNQLDRKFKVIKTQADPLPYSGLQDDYMAYKKLVHTALTTEKKTLINLRKSGELADDVFWSLMSELDIEEIRANTLRV